ncbi:MAG: Bifunctional deaminase-reductase domain protein [Acidimicrobiales bacterium]|nr:Bifunctional deaminase-reductase domain protein [Acidimicrobiales bacterium]
MRDVVLLHWLSLDGVSQEPSDWFFDDGPELFDLIGRVIATQDDVLLGRGTYDYWAGYWPTSDVEPFATFINSTPKHVATSSELTQPWNNTSVMSKAPIDYVRDLKQQPGGDIGIHASTELARSLIAARLVDHLRFVVPPNIAGHGKRLFDESATSELQRLDLVEVEQTPRGTLFIHYRASPTA